VNELELPQGAVTNNNKRSKMVRSKISKRLASVLVILVSLILVAPLTGCSSDNSSKVPPFEFFDGSLEFQLEGNWEYDAGESEAKTMDETNELNTIYYYSNLVDYSITQAYLEMTYNPYEGLTVPEFVELSLSVRFPTATNRMDSESETHLEFGETPTIGGIRMGKWYTSVTSDGQKRFFAELVLELGFITIEFRTPNDDIAWDQSFRDGFLNSLTLTKSYFDTTPEDG
jgi:hypothetical protein